MTSTIIDLDDAVLVRAVQEGDIEYFEPLVDRHLAAVRTFLSLRAPAPGLVDEIAHDTFVFAYQHLRQFAAGTSFRAWLRAIAWNLLRKELLRFSRCEARTERLDELWRAEVSGASDQPSADVEFLEECLASLPEAARTLVDLHYSEGNDSNAIAQRLARSRAWVRTTLFRIRQQLKSCIDAKRLREMAQNHA